MFKLKIITPKGIYFNQEVSSLTIKLETGYRTILSGHLPLVGILDDATMHLVKNNKTHYYAVHKGVLNVKEDEVVVVTHAIEKSSDIDIQRALDAKDRAEHRLKDKSTDLDIERAKSSLMRALSRINTYNLDK